MIKSMLEDSRFLLQWIQCGVPAVVLEQELKDLTMDILKG